MQVTKVDRHGFGVPKKQCAACAEVKQEGQYDGANQVNVREWVESDPAHEVGRAIAKKLRGIAMRSLVQCDGKDHRNGINRNSLNEIRSVHGVILSKSK